MGDPDKSKRVLELCDQALLLAGSERSEFLDEICWDDPELRASVNSLLRAVSDSGNFLIVDESTLYQEDIDQ